MSPFITPQWPAPSRVRALMSTRHAGDEALAAALPGRPAWLRQSHGTRVVDLDEPGIDAEGDAAVTRTAGAVCAIRVADCMPVLLADEAGSVVGAAHAGWRGLSAGVLEATLREMAVPGEQVLAWLGPAIGSAVYEVGEDVYEAFLRQDVAAQVAFVPNRPGHWLLDLYAVARQRLSRNGITHIFGGGFCTYSDAERFYSYRRDRTTGRMGAFIWLAPH
jgi:polyphenol oxidase